MSIERIIVVDDDLNMTKLLNVMLKSDYEVDVAHSVEAALQNFKTQDYDAVIVDLNIPPESGFELIEKVREDASKKWLPIIVLSGKEKSEDRIKSLELGADDYLTKPFRIKTEIKFTS